MLKPLAKYSRAQLADWHAQFMREVINAGASCRSAVTLVREHQDEGDLCCLVTATNAFITAPIAEAFGIETLIACEVETVDNHPQGAVHRPADRHAELSRRQDRARTEAWLASMGKQLWSDFKHSYFYSDSHNDIPLLEKVTDPIATNPDDALRAHAQAKGWRILELFQPT